MRIAGAMDGYLYNIRVFRYTLIQEIKQKQSINIGSCIGTKYKCGPTTLNPVFSFNTFYETSMGS